MPQASMDKPRSKCLMDTESAALGEKQQINTLKKIFFSFTSLVNLQRTVFYEEYLAMKNISTAKGNFNLKSIVRN